MVGGGADFIVFAYNFNVWLTTIPGGLVPSVLSRLAAHTVESQEGCWLWTGSTDHNGYGRFKIAKRYTGAHRAAWLAYMGDLPGRLTIDHLCRVRHCVNPWHLEPVTTGENTRRGDAGKAAGYKWRAELLKVSCANGHAFTDANTRIYRMRNGRDRRVCIACAHQRMARWLEKTKSPEVAP